MPERTVTTLSTGGCFFEGPRWHDGQWWMSDFYRHAVFTVSPDGIETQVVDVAAQPSGLGWLPDGDLLVVSMKDHKVLRVGADGGTTVHTDLNDLGVKGPCNDMVVSATGHAYVGSFGFELMTGETPVGSPLYGVAPDGTSRIVAEDLQFPNGTVITPDGSTLIVGESFGNCYTAFSIEAAGSLANRRVWADMAPDLVAPDGCTFDAEDHLWTADALGNRVVRIAPGGDIVDEIPAPAGMGVFACMLGGDDGLTLLMCLAPDYVEEKRKAAKEAELATARVDVPHAGLP